MSGQLYQLQVSGNPKAGDVVRISGPWDTWGVIQALRDNGYHLIRGAGHRKPQEKLSCLTSRSS